MGMSICNDSNNVANYADNNISATTTTTSIQQAEMKVIRLFTKVTSSSSLLIETINCET